MEKIASFNLNLCVHARNAFNEALCGHFQKEGELQITDKKEEITCPSCEIYKKWHYSQPK